MADIALNASDPDWSTATGHCGGCGGDECHTGRPCTADPCPDCLSRWAEGWFCPSGCRSDHRDQGTFREHSEAGA